MCSKTYTTSQCSLQRTKQKTNKQELEKKASNLENVNNTPVICITLVVSIE